MATVRVTIQGVREDFVVSDTMAEVMMRKLAYTQAREKKRGETWQDLCVCRECQIKRGGSNEEQEEYR